MSVRGDCELQGEDDPRLYKSSMLTSPSRIEPHPKESLIGRESKLKVQIKVSVLGKRVRIRTKRISERKLPYLPCPQKQQKRKEALWDWKNCPKAHFLWKFRKINFI